MSRTQRRTATGQRVEGARDGDRRGADRGQHWLRGFIGAREWGGVRIARCKAEVISARVGSGAHERRRREVQGASLTVDA
jgi:hypothetical protein